MNEELRALLIERGMPEDLDDEQAQQWLVENRSRILAAVGDGGEGEAGGGDRGNENGNGDRGRAGGQPRRQPGDDGANSDGSAFSRSDLLQMFEEVLDQREQRRTAFRTEVDQLVELAGLPSDFGRTLYGLPGTQEVREAILAERSRRATELPAGPMIEYGEAQRDKHRAALHTALVLRAFSRCEYRRADPLEIFPESQRAKDWQQFRHATLFETAVECLRMDGVDVRHLTREHTAMVALGFGDQIGVRMDPAYHVTGSFPFLTQDAVNKSLMLGFAEFPSTWRMVGTVGDPATDFKQLHRMQIGAFPNVPVWNDNEKPNQLSLADAEEKYAVECRSYAISLSYKTLVNDDMGVIGRMPMKFGDAFARTVNTVFWAQITGNPTMRDGQPLFLETPTGNRKRSNLTSGAGAPSSTTIQTLTDKMMQMRGENTPEGNESDDVLALTPSYIAGPSALRKEILQEVRSIADPSGGHSGVANIDNDLIPIIEPILDANSTKAWYLFVAPTRSETVEVTFLQGQEQPQVRVVMDAEKLSREHIGLQTFAAKALEHRGIQKHAGE